LATYIEYPLELGGTLLIEVDESTDGAIKAADASGNIIIQTKLDFVHLLDKTRTAGYAKFRPNCQEGMNHAQPARCDYTRAAAL
jgi:hypothetical protein